MIFFLSNYKNETTGEKIITFALILPEIVVFCCYKSSAPLSFTAIWCPPFIKTKTHLLFSSARAKMTKDLYGIKLLWFSEYLLVSQDHSRALTGFLSVISNSWPFSQKHSLVSAQLPYEMDLCPREPLSNFYAFIFNFKL